MALLFCDGADHYSTQAQALQKWSGGTSNAGGGTISVGSANGRFGTNSITMNGGSNGGYGYKDVTGQQTMIFGFAQTRTNWASGTIAFVGDGSVLHVDIRTDSSSRPFVTRNGTQLGSVAATVLAPGFHYFELKVKIDDSTGTAELYVDGAQVLNLTGQDTRNAGTAIASRFAIYAFSGETRVCDDVYICDTLGGVCNDFLGDIVVQTIRPNGNGNSSQLVGSDADSTDNYLLVDEATPNDDTDYVESATATDKDTYAFGSLTALTGTVHAVVSYAYAKKTDAGVRQLTTVARSGGTDEDGTTKTLSTTYGLFSDIRHTKPGGGAWSISDVNAAEFGVKVVA